VAADDAPAKNEAADGAVTAKKAAVHEASWKKTSNEEPRRWERRQRLQTTDR
jgi:hypothetical protein